MTFRKNVKLSPLENIKSGNLAGAKEILKRAKRLEDDWLEADGEPEPYVDQHAVNREVCGLLAEIAEYLVAQKG